MLLVGVLLLVVLGALALAFAADIIPDLWIDPKHLKGDGE